ncbi:hypothetical protein AAC387_Pa07g3411 [Persea americana]
MQRVKVQLGVFWEHLILLLLVEACYNFESCLQQFIHNFLMLLGCLIIEVQQISFSFILSFSLIQLESMEDFCLLVHNESLKCITIESDKIVLISATVAALAICCGVVALWLTLEEE